MYLRFQKNFLSFLLVLPSLLFEAAYGLDYQNQGSWGGQCQSSSGQSPINICTNDVQEIRGIPFKLINYKIKLNKCAMNNNGYGAFVVCSENSYTWPKLRLFSDTYKFHGLHFHWGSNNSVGSEHKIDDIHFALEMHIVHFNDKYNNILEAGNKIDGILVLGVLFEISDFSTSLLECLSETFPEIEKYGSTAKILYKFSLNGFLNGLNSDSFYTYMGSLTTPPCTPARWVILKDQGKTSDIVLNKFRRLRDSQGKRIMRNFRDIHPIENGNVISAVNNYLTQDLP